MKRILCYAGQQADETDLLNSNKNALLSISALARAALGSAAVFEGCALSATSPASLSMTTGAGSCYQPMQTDALAYSSLGTDTSVITKQGLYAGGETLTFAAPGTVGQSINYLVQAAVADVDGDTIVLPYFNSSDPTVPFSGPNNTGTAQPTTRDTVITLSVKAGAAATTGSQATPAPDSGKYGLWVVTVAYGATALTSSNVAQYSGSEYITHTLPVLQDNVKAVIQAAGLTLNPADMNQLSNAIATLISTAVAAETSARISAVNGEASTRAAADSAEATARASAVTAEANARTFADNLIVAQLPIVKVHCNSSGVEMGTPLGVSSITHVGTGVYRVNTSVTLNVNVNPQASSGVPGRAISWGNITASSIDITIRDSTNGSALDGEFSLVVFS